MAASKAEMGISIFVPFRVLILTTALLDDFTVNWAPLALSGVFKERGHLIRARLCDKLLMLFIIFFRFLYKYTLLKK
jgi:hypothetical protein